VNLNSQSTPEVEEEPESLNRGPVLNRRTLSGPNLVLFDFIQSSSEGPTVIVKWLPVIEDSGM
jgi:hypothetical protein